MEEPNTLPQTPNSAAASAAGTATAASDAGTATATATVTATAAAAAASPNSKKRKLEDAEFQNSKYFKMRAVVRDLRPLFVEVLGAPDFPNSKAAQDIQIKMKIVLELSKELRNETASSPTKFPEEQPLAGASKDGKMGKPQGESQAGEIPPSVSGNATVEVSPTEKTPNTPEKKSLSSRASKDGKTGKTQGGGTHALQPQAGEIPSAPGNATVEVSQSEKTPTMPEKKSLSSRASKDGKTGKPQGGGTHASQPQAGEIPRASGNATVEVSRSEKATANMPEKKSLSGRVRNTISARAPQEVGKQVEEGRHGTYVVGGSPIGWNFLLYPGGEAVYYGVTKASVLLRRAAK